MWSFFSRSTTVLSRRLLSTGVAKETRCEPAITASIKIIGELLFEHSKNFSRNSHYSEDWHHEDFIMDKRDNNCHLLCSFSDCCIGVKGFLLCLIHILLVYYAFSVTDKLLIRQKWYNTLLMQLLRWLYIEKSYLLEPVLWNGSFVDKASNSFRYNLKAVIF